MKIRWSAGSGDNKGLPEQHVECLIGEEWNVIAITQRGVSHERQAAPNQDSYDVSIISATSEIPETIIVAVADGAGSAPLAHEGARTTTSTATTMLRYLIRRTPESVLSPDEADKALRQAVRYTSQVLKATARLKHAKLGELATTIQLVLANERLISTLHIGDGRTIVDSNDSYLNLNPPYNGEYANETTFITSSENPASEYAVGLTMRTMEPKDSRQLAIFTDGLDPIAVNYSTDEPHAGFFRPAFNALARSAQPASAARKVADALGTDAARRKSTDDITLVMATRR